jgi:hypothetical protein
MVGLSPESQGANWVAQPLREALPEAGPYRYVILDRDSKFNATVIAFLKAAGLNPKRTSIQSPWQNGTAERGLEVVAERSWSMSSRWTNDIDSGSCVNT